MRLRHTNLMHLLSHNGWWSPRASLSCCCLLFSCGNLKALHWLKVGADFVTVNRQVTFRQTRRNAGVLKNIFAFVFDWSLLVWFLSRFNEDDIYGQLKSTWRLNTIFLTFCDSSTHQILRELKTENYKYRRIAAQTDSSVSTSVCLHWSLSQLTATHAPHPTPPPTPLSLSLSLSLSLLSLSLSCDQRSHRTVCWFLNVPRTCECISGTDLLRQFDVLPHWDRSCRSNFPSHPVTVFWHWVNQSQTPSTDPITPGACF